MPAWSAAPGRALAECLPAAPLGCRRLGPGRCCLEFQAISRAFSRFFVYREAAVFELLQTGLLLLKSGQKIQKF